MLLFGKSQGRCPGTGEGTARCPRVGNWYWLLPNKRRCRPRGGFPFWQKDRRLGNRSTHSTLDRRHCGYAPDWEWGQGRRQGV